MGEQMEFPETFEKFAKEYGFKDNKEIYTNGSELIPIFRVKQWLEHDNKLRTIETDTAYECDKHANRWIPVSERLPEKDGGYLAYIIDPHDVRERYSMTCEFFAPNSWWPDDECSSDNVVAWMPLPEPYKEEGEKNEDK